MISVGIFTGYYPYTLAETIERAKKDGMSCVQLDLEFKDIDLSSNVGIWLYYDPGIKEKSSTACV